MNATKTNTGLVTPVPNTSNAVTKTTAVSPVSGATKTITTTTGGKRRRRRTRSI